MNNVRPTEQILALLGNADLFRTSDDTAYARLDAGGHRENIAIESRAFKKWILQRYFAKFKCVPPDLAVSAAIGTISARAILNGAERQIWTRSAQANDSVYVDFVDKNWRCVEIDPHGWSIVQDPPVRFRRTSGQLKLPAPVRGVGKLSELRQMINLARDKDFELIKAWLLAALRPCGPYPILVFVGEQGTAKSTATRALKALIDPHVAPLRSIPGSERDLFIAANNSHVLAFDNVSNLKEWQSDALCRLATGGAYSTRALYENDEEVLFDVQKPVIINGIDDLLDRSDALDRSLIIPLKRIPDTSRLTEEAFWANFNAGRPGMLADLYDGLSCGLARLPTTHLPEYPRMADFAKLAVACENSHSQPGSFLEAYESNRQDADEDLIAHDDVASCVKKLAGQAGGWTGTRATFIASCIKPPRRRVNALQHSRRAQEMLQADCGASHLTCNGSE